MGELRLVGTRHDPPGKRFFEPTVSAPFSNNPATIRPTAEKPLRPVECHFKTHAKRSVSDTKSENRKLRTAEASQSSCEDLERSLRGAIFNLIITN
jgi:hypothetical protein